MNINVKPNNNRQYGIGVNLLMDNNLSSTYMYSVYGQWYVITVPSELIGLQDSVLSKCVSVTIYRLILFIY